MAKLTFGSCYFLHESPAATANSADTPVKASGTTVAKKLEGFTHTNGRLTCTGVSRTYEVQFNGSVSKGGGGSTESLTAIFKNGTSIVGSGSIRTIANASDHGSVSVLAQVDLGSGDYVEVWIQTDTGDDITIDAGVLSVKVIG